MKKTFTTVALFTFIGCGLGTGVAHGYAVIYNGFTPTPTTVYAYAGFEEATKSAIFNACQQWNWAGAGSLVTKNINDHNKTGPEFNYLNQITKGTRGTSNYLMYTTIYSDMKTNRILDADIDINVSLPWGNDGSSVAYDVGNAMTHELGHLLALGEEWTKTESTMYYHAVKGETKKRTIEQDDKDGILWLYKQ